MAVCWRCPDCLEDTCHTEYIDLRAPVWCVRCKAAVDCAEALCVVCDSPNPLNRRDTIHFTCSVCGNTQRLWSESA